MRASNECAVNLVNLLITFFVRVNVLLSAGSIFPMTGDVMKKVAQTKWSFWSWLLGCGTGAGGTQG